MKIPKDVVYFIPQYFDFGDGVEIFFINGEKRYAKQSIRTFIKNLYFIYAIDPDAVKRIISDKIGIKNILPIVLPEVTFIPVKVRTPVIKSDPCSGYVNLSQIARIDGTLDRFDILLKCGAVLKCLGTIKLFNRKIFIASFLTDFMNDMWKEGTSMFAEQGELENMFKMM